MKRKYGDEPTASTSKAGPPGRLGALLGGRDAYIYDEDEDVLPTTVTHSVASSLASSLGSAAKEMGLSLEQLQALMGGDGHEHAFTGPMPTAPGFHQIQSTVTSRYQSLRDVPKAAKEMGMSVAELETMIAEQAGGSRLISAAGERAVKRRRIEAKPPGKSKPRLLDGRIFLTPTPGRDGRNTMHISELVDRDNVHSAFIYAYFWTPDALEDIIPEATSTRRVIVGRDINQDGARYQVDPKCQGLDADSEPPKIPSKDAEKLGAAMAKLYKASHGYEAVYCWCSSSAHTKMWLLEHSDFLRVIITSSNAMSQDFNSSDNHWFVQDFPRHRLAAGVKPPKRTKSAKEFERILFGHALALGMPRDYQDDVLSKRFDFSRVRVSLVASTPGITRPDLDDDGDEVALGLLRLKQLVGEEKKIAAMEICSASVGKIDTDDGAWLRHVWHAVSGGKLDWEPKVGNQGLGGPPIQIVYPAVMDIDDDEAAGLLVLPKSSACQMGCHTKWNEASSRIKNLFRRYRSTCEGVLTHQKLLVAWHEPAESLDDVPSFVVFGSHNFSASAWGKIKPATKRKPIGIDIKNYELSVFVPGDVLVSLLAPGSVWTDLMTYERPAPALRSGDRPFNSKQWVKGARDEDDQDD